MKNKKIPKTIRRSVALPRRLVEEVIQAAAPDLGQNLNRLVTVALEEFLERRRQQAFEEAMARMASDPGIRAASAAINTELEVADADGLNGTP